MSRTMTGTMANFERPKHNEVVKINNLAHLQKVIKDYPGVIVNFWNPTAQICVKFNNEYQSMCHGNQNKNVIFCSVLCDDNMPAANHFNV